MATTIGWSAVGGIVRVIRNGLRWRDVPPGHGPHKAICDRSPGGAAWACPGAPVDVACGEGASPLHRHRHCRHRHLLDPIDGS